MRTGPLAQAAGNSRISAYQPPGKYKSPAAAASPPDGFQRSHFDQKIEEEDLSSLDIFSAISTTKLSHSPNNRNREHEYNAPNT
jgi:hypothetical protein